MCSLVEGDKGCPFKFEIESYLQGHPSVQILFHSVSTHIHLQEIYIFIQKKERLDSVTVSLFVQYVFTKPDEEQSCSKLLLLYFNNLET